MNVPEAGAPQGDRPPSSPPPDWIAPEEGICVGGGEVHVWSRRLDTSPERLAVLWETLDLSERERATRFHFSQDRDAYVARRGALRQLLGGLLERSPGCLRFSTGPRGKPSLPGTSLSFNLSRSAGRVLIAVTRGAEVGVDLERIRAISDRDRIAERFFSLREAAALAATESRRRDEAFFLCWTRKEAYVKARGEGLSLPLDSFSVSLDRYDSDALLEAAPEELSAWSVADLSPGAQWAGAIAVRCRGWRLFRWEWDEGRVG